MQNTYLILHNIRSTHNVGSILRTADGAGVKEVVLCGVTPTPIDRFGRKRSDIAKVSLGAEESVQWLYVEDVSDAIQSYKKRNISLVGVEQTKDSTPYNKYTNTTPTAFILGEETKGLPKAVLNQCDEVVEIPMKGSKESLNVSVVAGIILFRFIE